jgi:hypothetical protein
MEILMTREIYAKIENTLGCLPAETGGILGTQDGSIITAYYFDESAHVGSNHYSPNIVNCERVINEIWHKQKIHFCGFIHSHYKILKVSHKDVEYLQRIYAHLVETKSLYCNDLYMVITSAGNSEQPFELNAYSARQLNCKELGGNNPHIRII